MASLSDGRFVRARDALWRELAGVTLVRTVDNSDVVELWGTGALLWMALTEPVTINELAAELAALIDAPEDIVARDVDDALSDLVQRGVVTRLDKV